MNIYLLFILIKNRRLCLFTLSKSELFLISDISSIRTIS
jgi:hypothetical protein